MLNCCRISENEVEDTPRDEIEDLGDDDEAKTIYRDTAVNKYGDEVQDVVVETFSYKNPNERFHRIKRQVNANLTETSTERQNASESSLGAKANTTTTTTATINLSNTTVRVMGLRIEESTKEPKLVDEVIPSVLRETLFTMRLFGEGFTDETVIAFTHMPEKYGTPCHFLITGEYKVM